MTLCGTGLSRNKLHFGTPPTKREPDMTPHQDNLQLFAYVTTDRRHLIFSDTVDPTIAATQGLTPLFILKQPEVQLEPYKLRFTGQLNVGSFKIEQPASVIWKFPLSIYDKQIVDMPLGATILDVQEQGGELQVWALCNSKETIKEQRKFATFGTGEGLGTFHGKFLKTVQLQGGTLVLHVFEAT